MKKKVCVVLLLLSLISFLIFQVSNALEREVRIFAHTTGKTTLALHLHSVLKSHLPNNGDAFVTISRDEANRVTSLQIHATLMNRFAEDLSVVLYDTLSEYDSIQFGIPAGNLTNLMFLSGKGPVIPVKPVILGSIANQVRSDFISAGINQTIHRISLTYSIAIRYLSPLHDATDTISFEILLSETLIVGDVPIYKD